MTVNHYPWFLIGKPGFLIGYPRFLTEVVRNPGYYFKTIVSGSFNAPNTQKVENHRFILGILGLCEKPRIVITIRGFSSASWGFFCACELSQTYFDISFIAWIISL